MKFEYSGVVIIYRYKKGELKFLISKKGELLEIPKESIKNMEPSVDSINKEIYKKLGLKIKPDKFFVRNIKHIHYPTENKSEQSVKIFSAEIDTEIKKQMLNRYNFIWLTFDECVKVLEFETQKLFIKDVNRYLYKKKKMKNLNLKYSLLSKSKGFHLSKNLVIGEGSPDSRIMVIGQAPGANEDKTGRPFIGRAGKLLDRLLTLAKLERNEIYITSIVQFFPPKNRLPTKSEIDICIPFIEKQIRIIDPKLIITLGNLATEVLTKQSKITQIHGNIFPTKLGGLNDIPCFVTLHPAAGIRFKKNVSLLESDFKKLGSIIKDI